MSNVHPFPSSGRRRELAEFVIGLALRSILTASNPWTATRAILGAFGTMLERALAAGDLPIEQGAQILASFAMLRGWRCYTHGSRVNARDALRHHEILSWVESHPTSSPIDDFVRGVIELPEDGTTAGVLAALLVQAADALDADLEPMLGCLIDHIDREDEAEAEQALHALGQLERRERQIDAEAAE